MSDTPDTTKLAIDIGPVIVFILTLVVTKNPFTATTVFMVAMAAAMIFARVKYGSVPMMLILSGVMVLVFGGLTIYLHDQKFIQMKPSIYYSAHHAKNFDGKHRSSLRASHGARSTAQD